MGSVETMDKQSEFKYYYAFVFGDGCLEKPSSTHNSRLRIEHVSRNLDYCEYKHRMLSALTKVTMTTYYREDKDQTFTRLITERHPRYTTLYNKLYINGHKTIDPHVEAFLDWEFLAIVYQDDGTLSFNQNHYPQVILCLESFSWAELKMFRDWLAKRFNLHFEVVRKTGKQANGFRLRLKGNQIPYFFDNIRPFILPSFKYKIELSTQEAPEKDEDIVRSSVQAEGSDESQRLEHL
jgi:hypothetical protein